MRPISLCNMSYTRFFQRDILDNALTAIEVGPIVPHGGLRQGDPPYFYILCSEGLSAYIKHHENRGLIHATRGQSINYQKFVISFNRNIDAACRTNINNLLGVVEVMGQGKYIGLPSMVGKDKKSNITFGRIFIIGILNPSHVQVNKDESSQQTLPLSSLESSKQNISLKVVSWRPTSVIIQAIHGGVYGTPYLFYLLGKGGKLVTARILMFGQPLANGVTWVKPSNGWLKCNIDCALFPADGSFGIGICFRDSVGTMVQARTLCFPHFAPVIECEASTLVVALQIAVESGYAQVNFESDCQIVVNAIINGDVYVNELSTIFTSCRSLISSNAS
ncbi:hypothetical protein TSUD_96390 [Trifolium subterraneum]|nr:hypothetical protein TSUD_96390 [Trifolium subterraneum]